MPRQTGLLAGRSKSVQALLAVSRAIDWINARLGVVACWLVLIACLISAGNAGSRYLFSISSNAWLEIQWYLFSRHLPAGRLLHAQGQ